MTTGTEIIKDALENIQAHSVLSPAPPEAIQSGLDVLNSMIAEWEDTSIKMGCVPLKVPGGELSEPLSARNAIIDNLAIRLHPKFPGSTISPELKANASKGYKSVCRKFKVIDIPKKQTRHWPLGQGNKTNFYQTYLEDGDELG